MVHTLFNLPLQPYHYDLFQGDVGHTLMLGATGAGKSFALNFLLVQALQYDPCVLILDLGGSYRWLTQFLGGGLYGAIPRRERSMLLTETRSNPLQEDTASEVQQTSCFGPFSQAP